MSEFGFEVRLCARLEQAGLPGLPGLDDGGVLGRQLGASVHATGGRIVDVAYVEPGPEFEDRLALTPASIPDAAIEADVGVGRFVRESRAFDGPPERWTRVAKRAAEIGFFERERRNGQTVVRQVARYPDWFGDIVGIENKPDLGRPGDLEAQLRTDVSLGLLDRAILATESYVTRAHLNRIPDPVGVWRVDPDREEPIDVIRPARPLEPDRVGIEPLEWHTDRIDVQTVTPGAKARQRRRLAERAFAKGWRRYDLPACSRCAPATADVPEGATVPYCEWADAVVDPATTCGTECEGHVPGNPPDVDLDEERAASTAWTASVERPVRRQAGLDRFS